MALDPLAFLLAALAPAVVWVLWRGQTLSVELLRLRLLRLVRNRSQRWLYATVSFLGVLVHEASHALVLLLSGHGIRGFKVGMESGHVTPGRERGGVGMLFFLVAALAPLFVPPLLFLLAVVLATRARVAPWPDAATASATTWEAARDVLLDVLLRFPADLARILATLDLATWQGLLVLGVALLAMPAGRPSFVKGSRYHGDKDEGDVAVVRRRIRRNPLPFALFLLALYLSFVAVAATGSPAAARWYWTAFSAVWGVALCGIVLALFGAAWWSLAVLDGRVRFGFAWLGPAAFVAVQAAARLVPAAGVRGAPVWAVNAAAVAAWLLVAAALAVVLPRHRAIPARF